MMVMLSSATGLSSGKITLYPETPNLLGMSLSSNAMQESINKLSNLGYLLDTT